MCNNLRWYVNDAMVYYLPLGTKFKMLKTSWMICMNIGIMMNGYFGRGGSSVLPRIHSPLTRGEAKRGAKIFERERESPLCDIFWVAYWISWLGRFRWATIEIFLIKSAIISMDYWP